MEPNTPQKKFDEDEFIARMRRQHGDDWDTSIAVSVEDAKESAQNRNARAKKYLKRGEIYNHIIVSSCKYEGPRGYGDGSGVYSFRTKTVGSTKPPRTSTPNLPPALTPAQIALHGYGYVPPPPALTAPPERTAGMYGAGAASTAAETIEQLERRTGRKYPRTKKELEAHQTWNVEITRGTKTFMGESESQVTVYTKIPGMGHPGIGTNAALAIWDFCNKNKLPPLPKAKPKKQPTTVAPGRKPTPAPNLPPILTAPPELAADVLGAGATPTPQAKKPVFTVPGKPAPQTAGKQTIPTEKEFYKVEYWQDPKAGRHPASGAGRLPMRYVAYLEHAIVGGDQMWKLHNPVTGEDAYFDFDDKEEAIKQYKNLYKKTFGTQKAAKPKKQPATMKQATNCVYRVDEFQQIAQAWWTSSTIPLQNSLDAAKKLVAKATKKRQRQIDKANRDWRPNAWGADPEHGPRRIVKICNGKEVEYYPATKSDEALYPEYKAIFSRVGVKAPRGVKKSATTPKAAPKRKPAPNLPPILTAPPELAADVLGTGSMGLPPTAAPKPKRKPKKTAAKPAKKPPAATPKPKTKATKPKAKKTAATPKLTASQQEYLAIQGFVMVKRGGKYVRITG